MTQLILADAHVHIYQCFDLEKFLNSALKNFEISARQQGDESVFTAILFLAETVNESFFRLLEQSTKNQDNNRYLIKNWTFHRTKEGCSLYAHSAKGQGIFLIAGRQIVTEENLEVLALVTDENFEDGAPLEVVIQEIIDSGGIPVIPWGFGKWMGGRGAILTNLLETGKFPLLFLGDNSGRPIFWPRPSRFQQAERRGVKILPGTDPLPFASESWRPGNFGFTIQGSLNPEEPAKSIKQILLDPTTQPQAYGSLETPLRFVRNQLAMQLLKRQRRKP